MAAPRAVPATAQRLQAAVAARGAKVVATVDHAAAAKAEGLSLRPTVLVIFGNPKLGTPLMQSEQTAGLDLPLLADCPQITVDFLASDADPFDPGELGAVIAPPAIANALYSAGGTRLHSLPLGAGEV